MRIFRDRFRFRGFGAKSLQCVLAALVLTVSVLQGMSICFCDSKPQACGDEQCHSCHDHNCHNSSESDADQSLAHNCTHLKVPAMDALVLSSNIISKVISVVNSLLLNMICTADLKSGALFENKYSLCRTSQGPMHHLIYISKSVKILC